MSVNPWAARLAAVQDLTELPKLWELLTKPEVVAEGIKMLAAQGIQATPEAYRGRMSNDWEVRTQEIRLASQQGPTAAQLQTSQQKLADIDDQSFQATLDYGTAVEAYATAHARHKSLRAQTYLKFKGEYAAREEKLTDGMAETMADADADVAQAYFESELNEAKMKAQKSLLEHLDRSFQYHRSLMVREDRMDGGKR